MTEIPQVEVTIKSARFQLAWADLNMFVAGWCAALGFVVATHGQWGEMALDIGLMILNLLIFLWHRKV